MTDAAPPTQTLLQRLRLAVNRHYRRLATGFCFLVFMGAGLLLTIFVFMPLSLLPVSPAKKEQRGLALIHWCFRTFTKLMCFTGVIERFQVEGINNLADQGPVLFIANHPSLIDVVTLLGVLPRCNCIVKDALFRHPFMGGVLRGCGLLPNSAGVDLMALISDVTKRGNSLLVFPEGTRSPTNNLHPFNRGAARLALHCDLPIVPVVITCSPPTLAKGQPWHDVPNRAVTFTLQFHPPLPLPDNLDTLEMPRKVRALNRDLHAFFRKQLGIEQPA